jgi:putative RNA 2'-phosphotransferase
MSVKNVSKFLSLVLRHAPGEIGIELDAQGWVECEILMSAANQHGVELNRELLDEVVRTNDKQRFAFSEDGLWIRANQGHSVQVELDLKIQEPPAVLFHGTVGKYLDAIRRDGLIKRLRHHVHLSRDIDTAMNVGSRRGKAVILKVDAARMQKDGHVFYLSENQVWLTDHVPAEYIEFEVDVTALYRPVGPEELKLIEESGWKCFPPRLPEQPIFYPVTNEPYAIQIARDWNVKASGSGYVTKFHVDTEYLKRFPIQQVGGREHTELWVPAEELDEFNQHIVGPILVTQIFS